MFEIKCSCCNKVFLRELGRINEGISRGWKSYCSFKCQYRAKTKAQEFKCGNPNCNRVFKRTPNEIPQSGICFCSYSCAAIVNNPKSPKRLPQIKFCPICQSKFTGRRKYCSENCQIKFLKSRLIITKDKILQEIKKFYHSKGRIPLKREFFHYKAARFRFGTWNNAIIAAGFKPNPVKFAMKYIANDGHKCDSLAEKIIDDWFFARNIQHEVKIPYGVRRMTADFKVDDTYIEFFGLSGEVERYDELVTLKEKLWKEKRLKTIAIYPTDLFPKSKLDNILGRFCV